MMTNIDIDNEAWNLILIGAESFVEDAVDEDDEFDDDEFELILKRATYIIERLRGMVGSEVVYVVRPDTLS